MSPKEQVPKDALDAVALLRSRIESGLDALTDEQVLEGYKDHPEMLDVDMVAGYACRLAGILPPRYRKDLSL